VFQDQVLEVAIALAGFSVGEAEGLRRAMSRKRSEEAIEAFRARFVEGAVAFGLLAYQSAWLRHHYPGEFLCALLNAQPMGFYPPASLVRDAQRRGVEVRSPHVNRSQAKCSIEDGAVRIGLEYVTSLGADDAQAVAAVRERGGPFSG